MIRSALKALLVLSVAMVIKGHVTITGCTNAFVHLQCPEGNTLGVHQLQLVAGAGEICSDVTDRQPPPKVPPNLAPLCPTALECLYEEDICVGKSGCVFYLAANYLGQNRQTRGNSAVSITYSCSPVPGNTGGILGITIVTLALVIALIVTTFIICRRSGVAEEDASKYVQFDKDLTRTPSTSGEFSLQASDLQLATTSHAQGAVGNMHDGPDNMHSAVGSMQCAPSNTQGAARNMQGEHITPRGTETEASTSGHFGETIPNPVASGSIV